MLIIDWSAHLKCGISSKLTGPITFISFYEVVLAQKTFLFPPSKLKHLNLSSSSIQTPMANAKFMTHIKVCLLTTGLLWQKRVFFSKETGAFDGYVGFWGACKGRWRGVFLCGAK